MHSSFDDTFDAFITQYIRSSNTQNQGLITEYDSDWPSPCLQDDLGQLRSGQKCSWQPVKRMPKVDFTQLASALEIHIPEAYQSLLCRYYSLDLNAQHPRGVVTLLQVWNEEDFERFQKNIIAHVLMKRRLKLPDTLFFALTDEDDLVISLDVNTQSVVLEPVGKAASETLNESLSDFVVALRPAPQFVSL